MPLAAAGGARAFARGDSPQRRRIIMSYPRKLVRALAVLASEPGDARDTSELACRADAAAAGLACREETAGPQPRLSQAAAIRSLARKGLLGACLADPACRKVLAEHHLMGSSTGELHLRPQAR
jgi:hypothetical protein